MDSLKAFVKNKDFMKLLLVNGVAIGILDALGLLINPTILAYFPGCESVRKSPSESDERI